MSVLNDPALETRLAALHARSNSQSDDRPTENQTQREFLSDKLVALDSDKAEFCYQLCRAIGARNIIEVGTSFGVSTIYLAAAVRDNMNSDHAPGRVIGTEHEPNKAAAARDLFVACGLSHLIDLREGDLRQTLCDIDSPIDLVLVDIWEPMARPAIELIYPHLRIGSVVICDNTLACRSDYEEYFQFINDPANGFRTMTLPFDGGLEMSVRL